MPTGSFARESTKHIEPSAINNPIGAPNGKALVGTIRLPCLIHSAGMAVTAIPIAMPLMFMRMRVGMFWLCFLFGSLAGFLILRLTRLLAEFTAGIACGLLQTLQFFR